MKTTLLLILLMLSSTLLASQENPSRGLASISQNLRVDHARELLGKRYKRSVVSRFEDQEGMELNILATVTKRLPKAYRGQARAITSAIINEATAHELDPYFVMAVISGESSFNPLAKGPVGEIGLMQLRSSTGKWMAGLIKMKWRGERTMKSPIDNIKLGTAYLAWLRKKFDNHGQLYLAAYNMGAKSVKNALGRNIRPKDYPIHVMKRYLAFYKEMNTQKI